MVKKKIAPFDKALEGSTQPEGIVHRYKPDARECALLVLELMRLKEEDTGKEVSRLRIAEISLKRLWCRSRITPELVEAVAEWLAGAEVALFYTGLSYAVIRTSTTESWMRATSKRMADKLTLVAQGTFDFTHLEHLLSAADAIDDG